MGSCCCKDLPTFVPAVVKCIGADTGPFGLEYWPNICVLAFVFKFHRIQLLLGFDAHGQRQLLSAQWLCVCVVQMLVFKLASLLLAVQGRMDSPAGVRLKVRRGHSFAVAAFAAHDGCCCLSHIHAAG